MSLVLNGIIRWGPIFLIVVFSLLLQVPSPFDIKVKFILEQATKTQRGSSGIALLFL
jgi:hypothetical protein